MNKIAPNLNKGQVPASQAFPFEKEILEWNLEESIQRIKPKVETFRRCAADLAKELYIAHEVLAVRGGDRKTEDAPVFTWSDFCEAVGISRKTAGKYMSLYDPAQDKVLDPEELAERKNLLIAPDSAHEARVAHAMATGERPEGWTDEDEREYRKRRQNERFAELAKKWGDRNFHLSQASGRDYFAEAMKNAKDYARFNLENRDQTAAQYTVFDNLETYLKTFADPSTRLAAAYNIGLKVRGIINEMALQMEELSQFGDAGET